MSKVLTYIDKPFARQMATSLIGSEVQLTNREDSPPGMNFAVVLNSTRSSQRSATTKAPGLLPELLADALYDASAEQVVDFGKARRAFVGGSQDAYRPRTPIVISDGCLISEAKQTNVQLADETCICYRLLIGGYNLRSLRPDNSRTPSRRAGQPANRGRRNSMVCPSIPHSGRALYQSRLRLCAI